MIVDDDRVIAKHCTLLWLVVRGDLRPFGICGLPCAPRQTGPRYAISPWSVPGLRLCSELGQKQLEDRLKIELPGGA